MSKMPQLRVIPPGLSFVCREVLEYDVPGLRFDKPPVVLDIGANIGAFAVWAQERWPGAELHCFEPHPEAFRALGSNVVANLDDRAVLGGWGNRHAVFQNGPDLAGTHVASDGQKGDFIAGVLHASLLPPCDIIKLDIEGAELPVLQDYQHFDACKVVLLEYHSADDIDPIAKVLSEAGFVLHSSLQHGPNSGVMRWLKPEVMPAQPPVHLFLTVLGWKLGPFHVQSREQLVLACRERNIGLTIHADQTSGVDRARNISIELARAKCPEFTHFMFIDSDLAFDPEDVIAMMTTPGLDVVGGAYPKKHVNWKAVEAAVKAGVPWDQLALHANDFVANAEPGKLKAFAGRDGRRYAEVEEVGTGFLMLTRDCIERYIAHWRGEIAYITDYEPKGVVHHMVFACERDPHCQLEEAERRLRNVATWYPGLESGDRMPPDLSDAVLSYIKAATTTESLGRYLTEDYSFCRRWRMMGEKVYCAVDARLVHQGPMLFEGHLGTMLEAAQ